MRGDLAVAQFLGIGKPEVASICTDELLRTPFNLTEQ
jgi:hypothetical protein